LAKRLSQELGFLHLSTGDVLRAEVAQGTELGRQAKEYMDRGELVPDELILAMVRSRVAGEKKVLFDGFPRTLAQARGLEEFAPVSRVVFLSLAREEVIRRLSSRRVCLQCGALYNLLTQRPREDERCDHCGVKLVQRDDDKPEVIARRYDVYERESAPLVDFYRARGLLVEVDASLPPEEVYQRVRRALS
jgi:adenylate kinase